jgi:putative oxidoreductase
MLILRLSVGLILFPHGAQKMSGIFSGYDYKGSADFFIQFMGLPWLIAFLVIVSIK